MSRQWPDEQIEESSAAVTVPVGPYKVKPHLDETTSSTGKLMYKFTGRIIEGPFVTGGDLGEYAGCPLFENFTIGSNTDPDAVDPETWIGAVGARQMKQLFTEAGLYAPELGLDTKDVDGMLAALNEVEAVGLYVQNKLEAAWANGAPVVTESGQPKMEPRNRVNRFVSLDKLPVLNGRAAAAATTAPPAVKRPVGRPPKAATPTPAVSSQQAAPAAVAKPAPAKIDPLIACPACFTDGIKRSQFPAHAAVCTAGEE